MPNCYLLAITQGSVLDHYTNNWTLFSLTETLRIGPDQQLPTKPIPLAPFEVHVYWYLLPEEFGTEFEWRLVFVTPKADVPAEETFPLKSQNKRYRIRIMGFPILATGQILLRVEWRKKGDQEWSRSDAFWPIDIEHVTNSSNTPSPNSNSLPKR